MGAVLASRATNSNLLYCGNNPVNSRIWEKERSEVNCPRCGRNHSSLCGIPAGVTKGFGAKRRLVGRRLNATFKTLS